AGVKVVCYNFMPVFDWTRTELDRPLPDGSNSGAFDIDAATRADVSRWKYLPGWDTRYTQEQLQGLLSQYQSIGERRLQDHLAYFLERIIPIAKKAGIKLA